MQPVPIACWLASFGETLMMGGGEGRSVRELAMAVSVGVSIALLACSSKHAVDLGAGSDNPGGGETAGPGGGGTDGGAGSDGGTGSDAGGGGAPDGGIIFGGPGPWPLTNMTYTRADGILETPVVGTSTDETQNLWVATHDAVYLLKPGDARFKRYAAADGLHLQSNPVRYCDSMMPGGDRLCPIWGGAVDPGIAEIVGGGPNEVFVGYFGDLSGSRLWDDPRRHTGMVDRVRLQQDGTLQVDRFDMVYEVDITYWYNGTVQRMIYDHFIHKHELYVGCNHGVTLFRPDKFRYPRPDEWFNNVNKEWMGDHVHPFVCYHHACTGPSDHMIGGWRGLALASDGDLWVAGRWTAGKIRWDPDSFNWTNRIGSQTFAYSFGDPYDPTAPPGSYAYMNQPVFRPPAEGDPVSLSAVSVAPDGRIWFASAQVYQDVAYGVAVWDGRGFQIYDPIAQLGMAERNVQDLIALPDGRIVLAGPNTGLVLWNPSTGARQALRAPTWLADDQVQRLELDTMVSPPALHVSTQLGATVIRQLPP